jgi:hypothetical protein
MTRSILMAFSLFFPLYISATGEKLFPPFFPILQGYLFPLGFLLTCLSISLGGTTPGAQNTVHRFWLSDGGIGGGARYWGLACRQKGPARATRIFRGTAFQWRRWVRSCTSTAP